MLQKELSTDELIQSCKDRESSNKALMGGAVAAAGTSTFFAISPAKAEGVADVTAAVSSIAAVATAAVAVVVVALAVRLGIKQVNRILTKG